jgi:hypothetical protein
VTLQRKTPLRRTPLARVAAALKRTELKRTTAIRRVKAMKAKPRRRSTKTLVQLLTERSGGLCEMQVPGVCRGLAVDPCHRIGTKIGGRQGAAAVEHDRLSNALHGCRSCHEWQTATGNRKQAEGLGWVLREGADTEGVRCWYRDRWVWLTDGGGVLW